MAERFTIIRGGRLMDPEREDAPPRDILIDGARIAEIGPPGLAAPEGARVIDASRRLLHPGLVNAHSHGHGALSKGMGDLWTLELLLNDGPAVAGRRELEDKRLSTRLGAVEMLMKGCTAVYDMTAEFPSPTPEGLDACAEAYVEAGMTAVLAPMFNEFTLYDSIPGLMEALPPELRARTEAMRMAPAAGVLATLDRIARGWRHDAAGVHLAFGPGIPHHCSDEFLLGVVRLAREHGRGVQTHLQESKVQVIAGLRRYGMTPAAHLEAIGALGPDFVLAHGTWLGAEDMARLAAHGCSVAHNPGSNLRLGAGIADAKGMLRAGINLGVGTDGAVCSDNLNMFEAMRLASLVSKSRTPDTADWLTTREAAFAATVGSARLLGLGDEIGRIAPGYRADIVFLDLDHPNWMPFNDAVNQWVHVEDGTAVHSVMTGGVMRVEAGRPLGVDLPALAAQVEAARLRIHSGGDEARRLADALGRVVNVHCPALAREPLGYSRYGSCEGGCGAS